MSELSVYGSIIICYLLKYLERQVISHFPFIMGNHCQTIKTQPTAQSIHQQITLETINEPNVEFSEQYDNPKHNLLGSNFLSLSCSSNDLKSINGNQNLLVSHQSIRRFSLYKIDSLQISNQFENGFQTNDMIKESLKKDSIKHKRNSISYPLENLKSNIHNRIFPNLSMQKLQSQDFCDTRPQSFVNMKKLNIEKYYQFLEKIGEGSFGNVMKALCLRTNQLRAIKIMKKQPLKKKEKSSKNGSFKQLQILRQLDHPNIIKIYEVYFYNDSYYLVMQLCEGGSILGYLKQNKTYSQNIVKAIIKQLLSALSYMHSAKIAHRDIKLENIVFIKKINQHSKKQDVQIKIIDFGLALELKYPHNNKDKREVGTISYMAPEVLDGLYSQKCDIWSCGVILWIMLSGRNPFKRQNKKQTIESIRSKVLQFRNDLWTNVSQNLKLLIMQMLQKNSLKRILAKQALKNPWFSEESEGLSQQKMKEVVKKLYSYYRESHLVSVIESYLTFLKISQEERLQITKVFKKLDKDLSGSIDFDELNQYIRRSSGLQKSEEIEFVLEKIRLSKNRKIDLNQFVTAFYNRKELLHEKTLQLAFRHFDADGSGFIDKRELQNALRGCNKEHVNQILNDVDKNGDQKISMQEFISYLKSQKFF